MKKIGFIAIALVTVLATLGIGFSMWSQTVTVSGTVNTGNLLVGIRSNGFTTDAPPNYLGETNHNVFAGNLDPNVVPWGNGTPPSSLTFVTATKNIASLASLENGNLLFFGTPYPTDNAHNYYDFITENVVNAYPFYAPGWAFVISNGGSVPVKINGFSVTDPNNILGTVVFYWGITEVGTTMNIVGHGTIAQLGAALDHPQIEKGQQLYITITMVFLESTPQNASGTFSIAVSAAQWDEVS
jgi:hypothetical protein